MYKLKSTKSETCDGCHGSGMTDGNTCSDCNGTGII